MRGAWGVKQNCEMAELRNGVNRQPRFPAASSLRMTNK
jgi:hypothetical protein